MSPEEIAYLDQQLKKNDKGSMIGEIDQLFFASEDRAAIVKIKPAAKEINKVKEWLDPDKKEMWEKALREQIRFSIDKVKNMSHRS